ncbi:SDR family NAD(P)-dependent oxidoreductase [Micromonospora sp. NPDC050980]|uniref:SDR family NAD(P)-dependent oxidoreductase n=1 Tax=Micromonospora sp. NPDC050980 TaxID=3155161 RepID=UPI0033DC2E21
MRTARFTDRVALVTGSTMGIGLAIAEALHREGARVVLNGRTAERTARAAEELAGDRTDRVLACAGDVADEDAVGRVVDTVLDRWGPPDILVNNAGIPTVGHSERLSLARWQRCLDVNLTGTFLFSRAVGAAMVARGTGGAIVNISSVAGIGGLPYRAAYGATKSAQIGLTSTLAAEWGQHGIRVNAVAPAFIRTPMTEFIVTEAAAADAPTGDWTLAGIEGRTPLGRMGEPGEVADAVLFLASDEATFISGATLPVDGGWTAFGAWHQASRPMPPAHLD